MVESVITTAYAHSFHLALDAMVFNGASGLLCSLNLWCRVLLVLGPFKNLNVLLLLAQWEVEVVCHGVFLIDFLSIEKMVGSGFYRESSLAVGPP